MELSVIIIMSILVEAIITYTKTWIVDKKIQWQMIVSVVLSIIICATYGLDIPAAVGIASNIPYVGYGITGILISRGSNYLFDLIKKIAPSKETPLI